MELTSYLIMALVLVAVELFVERKLKIRAALVTKFGALFTVIGSFLFIIMIQLLCSIFFAKISDSQTLRLCLLGILLFFLPKKGDQQEKPAEASPQEAKNNKESE